MMTRSTTRWMRKGSSLESFLDVVEGVIWFACLTLILWLIFNDKNNFHLHGRDLICLFDSNPMVDIQWQEQFPPSLKWATDRIKQAKENNEPWSTQDFYRMWQNNILGFFQHFVSIWFFSWLKTLTLIFMAYNSMWVHGHYLLIWNVDDIQIAKNSCVLILLKKSSFHGDYTSFLMTPQGRGHFYDD